MKPMFLLVHGWGFGASFWAPLQQALCPEASIAWDLGFFGTPAQPPLPANRPVVAVGHSFGLLWLLHHRPVVWRALAAINGFTCFTRRETFPAGNPARPLQRLIRQCAKNPQQAVTAFRASCGTAAPLPGPCDQPRLQAGLHALLHLDERPALPDIALCGRSDPLIPMNMSLSNFPPARIAWHDGGHLLPLEDPAWCAAQLRQQSETLP